MASLSLNLSSGVLFCATIGGHVRPVNDSFHYAFAIKRTVVPITYRAVACSFGVRGGNSIKHFLVVLGDNALHAWHATVTDFQGVLIENIVELMTPGEVPFDNVKELPSYIGFNRCVKWGVKP